jgi:hypothetical protein
LAVLAVVVYTPAAASDATSAAAPSVSDGAGLFVGITPQRIFDTRIPIGTPVAAPLGPGQSVFLPLRQLGYVPAEATAVAFNLTTDSDATELSFITAWPGDEPRPFISVNNPAPGRVTPTFVLSKIGADGSLGICNTAGSTSVVIDLLGYVIPAATAGGGDPGPAGPTGPGGPAGPAGPAGRTLHSGAGLPQPATGSNGDFYVDTTTSWIYGPKTAGVWPDGLSLVGPPGPAGRSVLNGVGVPTTEIGLDGDFYLDTQTKLIHGPKTSGAWPAGWAMTGAAGPSGTDGRSVLNGVGAPEADTGSDGDFYLDTASRILHGPKTSGSWGVGWSTTGPAGPPGAPGRTILSGTGAPGNGVGTDGDFYLDTAGHLFHGPKSAGAWPAGWSLNGPTGPTGPGAQTSTGAPATGAACAPTGLVNVALVTGELNVCDGGVWSPPLPLRSTIDNARTFDMSMAATNLDENWVDVATFTAPTAGTYVLEGATTLHQAVGLLGGTLVTGQCVWTAGGSDTGPTAAHSAVIQPSLLHSNDLALAPMGRASLAATATATLRCRVTGLDLVLGDYRAQGWSISATRIS